MPYMKNGKRDYKTENKKYNSRPANVKKRMARNNARSAMAKKGLVRKGDGKDVDHRVPLSKGGTNSTGNLRVRSQRSNRAFARTRSGKMR